jgi:integrase
MNSNGNRILFNDKALGELKPAAKGKRVYYYDKKVEGLGISVTDAGGKTFIVYRWFKGKPYRLTLGKFNANAEQSHDFEKDPLSVVFQKDVWLNSEQARRVARIVVAELDAGKDVKAQRDDVLGELTFGQLFTLYVEQYAKLQTKRWQDTEENYRRYFSRWEGVVVSEITQRELQLWVNDLAKTIGKHTANRQYDTMRAVFSWGMRKQHIKLQQNPCIGVDRFTTKHRERFVLPGDEFERLAISINAEKESLIRDFFWMCLFTGARRSNVLAMRWDQINLDLHTWTIPETKNGDSQSIALTTDAMALLRKRMADQKKDKEWVFPSDSKSGHFVSPKTAWKRIIERAEIEDLRIHDLRRTVGSYMAIQGVSPTIIGKALGHRSPQATAIYARLTQDPVRQALESVQAALTDPTKLVKSKKKNVVELNKRKSK